LIFKKSKFLMSSYTEDHLVEQPAIQLIQHELGWDVMNCFGDPSTLKLRRTGWKLPGKTEMLKTEMLKQGAIDGAVEEMGILNDGFWVLNGREARQAVPGLCTKLSPVEANREIDKLLKGGVHARINGFQSFRPFHRLVKQSVSLKRPRSDVNSLVSRLRENEKNVKIRLYFTRNPLFMTT